MGVERVKNEAKPPSRVRAEPAGRPRAPSGAQLCDHIQPEILPHHPQDDAASYYTADEDDYARREATVGELSQSSRTPNPLHARPTSKEHSTKTREWVSRGSKTLRGCRAEPCRSPPLRGCREAPCLLLQYPRGQHKRISPTRKKPPANRRLFRRDAQPRIRPRAHQRGRCQRKRRNRCTDRDRSRTWSRLP